jgi:hypothetical protein
LGLSVTGSNNPVLSLYGSSPSYVDLMQRTFNRADEKALIVSLSYDFAGVGVPGLTLIANYVAAFDGKDADSRGDAQELDVTLDYQFKEGPLDGFWLRVRGSWLRDELVDRDATEVRVILRYELSLL